MLPDLELRSVHIHTGSPLELLPSPGGPTMTSHGAAAAHVFPEQTRCFSLCARFQSINPPDSCAWPPGLQPALYHVLECHPSRVQSSCPDCVDKPPGAQLEGLEPIQWSPLTRVPQGRAQALYGLMHSAAPGGGVCDHSVLIMEGSNVFVLGLSNIFFPPIPVGRLALAVPAVKPSLIERQGMALIKS